MKQKIHRLSDPVTSLPKLPPGATIVATNGCFDIIHAGHADFLHRCAKLGGILVVGINSDESVKRNKGDSRPIISEYERALVLASMECVDVVVIFDESTCEQFLRTIRPSLWVKGDDYAGGKLNATEVQAVNDYDGMVVLLPLVKGLSTTAIINKIKSTP